MKLNTLNDVLTDSIKDLYSAETQITKALPKMAKAAGSPKLKQAFETHLAETEKQVERLEKVAELMGISVKGKTCVATKGLVEEGQEIIDEDGTPEAKDAALIGAAQKIEHYEIAGYGTARSLAEKCGLTEVASLLQQTLDEEGATDKKLTAIAEALPAPTK